MISRTQVEEISLRYLGDTSQPGQDINTLLTYIEEQDRFIRATSKITDEAHPSKKRRRRKLVYSGTL